MMILEIERHWEGIERGNQSLLLQKPNKEDWQFAKQGDRQVDGVISQAPGRIMMMAPSPSSSSSDFFSFSFHLLRQSGNASQMATRSLSLSETAGNSPTCQIKSHNSRSLPSPPFVLTPPFSSFTLPHRQQQQQQQQQPSLKKKEKLKARTPSVEDRGEKGKPWAH